MELLLRRRSSLRHMIVLALSQSVWSLRSWKNHLSVSRRSLDFLRLKSLHCCFLHCFLHCFRHRDHRHLYGALVSDLVK
jgi:hypothetical protein